MSKLIEMRQRIKTVQTIKKVTHAMRLIAMAHSTAAKHKTAYVQAKSDALRTVVERVSTQAPRMEPAEQEIPKKTLVILIGSQKGLCGNFNTYLLEYYREQQMQDPELFANAEYILIGKKLIELTQAVIPNPLTSFAQLSNTSVGAVGQQLASIINTTKKQYSRVLVLHNFPKSFFVAKPTTTDIYTQRGGTPLLIEHESSREQSPYYWYEDPHTLLRTLEEASIQTAIQSVLLTSLNAEHAARFIAMDNATRNAQELMDTMQLDYHKLRQAKITKELTDLIASF
ncbi:MAG: FoF1 ATP synthase subunit gamma [Candidatus Babeliales bacterium]